MDNASKGVVNRLHPAIREKVTLAVEECNKALTGRSKIRLAQGTRTFPEQDALYKKRPKVTNAKAGQSIHNYGLAVDIVLIIDGKVASWDVKKDWDQDKQADWMECVSIFKKHGFKWGGNWISFKDMPHFEMTFDHTWQTLLPLYQEKKFIPGTTFVQL